MRQIKKVKSVQLTGFLPPLRFGGGAGADGACPSPMSVPSSASGVEEKDDEYLSRLDSRFGTTASERVTSVLATEPMPAPRNRPSAMYLA